MQVQEGDVHLGVVRVEVGLAATGLETVGAWVDGEGAKPWASPAMGVGKMGRSPHRRMGRSGQGAGGWGGGLGGRPPRGQVQEEFHEVAKWYGCDCSCQIRVRSGVMLEGSAEAPASRGLEGHPVGCSPRCRGWL